MAAEMRPTTMSMPPVIPASVSEKPWGARIWFKREETLLKRPT